MDIQYTIVGLDKSTGTIAVKYFTVDFEMGLVYDLTLPIDPDTNTTLNGQELVDFIMFNAPKAQLAAAIEKVKEIATVDFSHIEALVQIPDLPIEHGIVTAAGPQHENPVLIGKSSLG